MFQRRLPNTVALPGGVKHLNPRQGITITTSTTRRSCCALCGGCETPKSPPGDYNSHLAKLPCSAIASAVCETPKSPPGDYNLLSPAPVALPTLIACETPKSPPGDYNTCSVHDCKIALRILRCETPKSPPGDYNSGLCVSTIMPLPGV